MDGNVYKDYRSCARTQKQTDPWWRVDLQQRVRVTHVKIYNRNWLGERLCGFEIQITESPVHGGATRNRCGELKHIRQNSNDVVICRPPVTGRYVTIVIPGSYKILTLCEVQVYGTSVLGKIYVSVWYKCSLADASCRRPLLSAPQQML